MTPLQKALDKIKVLSLTEKKGLLHRGLKLSEETGELSQAILGVEDVSGMAYKGLNVDDVKEEAIDVLQVVLSICYMVSMTDDEIAALLEVKSAKWEKYQSKG